MTEVIAPEQPAWIVCADWGKAVSKRAVWVAEVRARLVTRLPSRDWTLGLVLAEAVARSAEGPVLVGLDVPFGLPDTFLAAARRRWPGASWQTFPEALAALHPMPGFFEATSDATDWALERPFFRVPAGPGGLTRYRDAAARHGVDLYRRIDRDTGAKTLFATSGIPGSVGSSTCAVWRELAPLLAAPRRFRLWPFEGDLGPLCGSTAVVMGELYPRAAYASALCDLPVSVRPPLALAKTDADVRAEAVATLLATRWRRELGVEVADLDAAVAGEDDFDAALSAAAMLRMLLEGTPLAPARLAAAESEGGILGTGSLNLGMAARTFRGGK